MASESALNIAVGLACMVGGIVLIYFSRPLSTLTKDANKENPLRMHSSVTTIRIIGIGGASLGIWLFIDSVIDILN